MTFALLKITIDIHGLDNS